MRAEKMGARFFGLHQNTFEKAIITGGLCPSWMELYDGIAVDEGRVFMKILVLNSGGSSVKFQVIEMPAEQVISIIEFYADKAPLHNPPNLLGIQICRSLFGEIPQIAVFDHALHKDLPDYAYNYGLPYRYYEKYGVRKYGFHGITFQYMTARACEIINRPVDRLRIVSLMLGSGCTANAMKYGKSIDVSTGFTPFEGLIQSTRCGDVDTTAAPVIGRAWLSRPSPTVPENMWAPMLPLWAGWTCLFFPEVSARMCP